MTTVEQFGQPDPEAGLGDAPRPVRGPDPSGGNAPLGVAGGILLSLPLWLLIIGTLWVLFD